MGTAIAPIAERREFGLASDHDLVAAVRQGDDRAFEKLYGRYQRRIAAYVYGMVNDYGRAEDITQEVFISALRRMRETDRPIAFKPWIYEIAKNACIDQFRRSRRTEEVSFDADDGAGALETARLAAPGATPDVAVDNKQQLDHLCGAFGGLSETHHQILVLRELEGLSYRQIGEKMGLSRPSVESTLFRARRRLTEEYDDLVSGQRCIRIQTIITTAGEGSLGARDQRRLARHIAHCQPCRREARLAGLDAATLGRSAREVVAAKVAAFLPIPAFLRGRKSGAAAADGTHSGAATQWSSTLSSMAEPIAGWTKAAVAAVLVAGGAGVAGHELTKGPSGGSRHESAPIVAKPAADTSSTKAASPTRSGSKVTAGKGSRSGSSKKASGGGASGGGGASSDSAPSDSGATAPEAGTPAGSGSLPSLVSGAPTTPSILSDATGGDGDALRQADSSVPTLPSAPTVTVPAEPVDAVETIGTQVDQVVDETVQDAGEIVGGVPGG